MVHNIGVGTDFGGSAAIRGNFAAPFVARVHVQECGTNGIVLFGDASVAEDCTVVALNSSDVTLLEGIRAGQVRRCTVRNVVATASGSTARGVWGRDVADCAVYQVSGTQLVRGIDSAGRVANCLVEGFPTTASVTITSTCYGIMAPRVTDCVVRDIRAGGTGAATFVIGIYGSHVTGCTVERVQGLNTVGTSSNIGIRGGPISSGFAGASVETAIVSGNLVAVVNGPGIQVVGLALIERNRVLHTDTGISNSLGQITGNIVSNVVTGISSSGNVVVRGNSVHAASGTAYLFNTSVRSGPLITTGGVGTTFDPNANFQY